jgi:hypothetical protein
VFFSSLAFADGRFFPQQQKGFFFRQGAVTLQLLADNACMYAPGLPDFSWYNIPKRGKIPNNHKIYQMGTKYTKLP